VVRYRLAVHLAAKQDLESISWTDPASAGILLALLEQIAVDPRVSRYYVRGVFTRDFNYDASDPRSQRVLALYDDLDVPSYR
jgi:hypothetical protein